MSTALAAQPIKADTDPRSLVSSDLLARLTARIVRDHGTDARQAERVMIQALAFLQACALNPGTRLSPSPAVDVGWHTFVLYTREYAAFCDRIAGRFIHHAPDDETGYGHGGRRAGDGAAVSAAEAIGATVAAMRAAGLPVEADLWAAPSDCSQCHAGCHDSPLEGPGQ